MKYYLFRDVTQRTLIVTDVSGQLSVPSSRALDCLILGYGTDRLFRNAGNYLSILFCIIYQNSDDIASLFALSFVI